MIRQRVKLRRSLSAYVVHALAVILGLALVWYGLMAVLLAVKVSTHTVNSLSAYRTLFDRAANLRRSDFTTPVRLIAGFGGLIAFVVFLWLAWRSLPRPYLARGEVELDRQERGATVVGPRAIERVAEFAARAHPDITAATGRLGDQELNVSVGVRSATRVAKTLSDVRGRVGTDLDRHQLPALPVNVTLITYEPTTRRELS